MKEYSKNNKAKEILGYRFTDEQCEKGVMPFDLPESLGYKCPKCGNKYMDWSEYACMLWCSKCNFDYFTGLCCGNDFEKANNIILDCINFYKGK